MSTNGTKTIKGRIQNKHNTESEWYVAGTATNPFIPLDGELIIYDPDSINKEKRFKFGDGATPVHLLPFFGSEGKFAEDKSKLDYLYGKHSEGLAYTLSNDGTYYTVKGIGTCADTDVAIPPIYNGLPVTSIDAMAFQNCSSLISVVIPNSVTSIGQGAFSTCENLVNIVIPESVTSIDMGLCFYCTSLSNVVIPNSVTIIGQSAFQNCSSLESVTIPDSVATIGNYAFQSCSGLTSVTIPDGVTSIGDYAFQNCSSLENMRIPDSVTSIGISAFDGCSSLTGVVIPDSVTSIGVHAFYYCSSLTIYCEAESQPSGWNSSWNSSDRPVVWGAALDFVGVNDKIESLKSYIDETILGGEW